MRTAIIGGFGRTAGILATMLSNRGDEVISTTRSKSNRTFADRPGVTTAHLDLERETSGSDWAFLRGTDAIVFAAGAGYGSSEARKVSVDRDGAARASQAALAHGVPRFVMVSSMGANASLTGSDPFSQYLRLKGEADEELTQSSLDWTIVRPSGLRNGPGTGAIRVGRNLGGGSLSRFDLARVLLRVLDEPITIRQILDVTEGPDPIQTAQLNL